MNLAGLNVFWSKDEMTTPYGEMRTMYFEEGVFPWSFLSFFSSILVFLSVNLALEILV